MSTQIQAYRTDTSVPLELTVSKNGGVTGLTALVKVRDATTTNSYLDFADSTFKTSGWTTQSGTLTEIGGGVYHYALNVNAMTNLPAATNHLVAEYTVSGSVTGVDSDIVSLRVFQDADRTSVTETWQVMGLDSANAMSVSTSARTTGSISQTISDAAGTVTVTRT